RRDGGRHPVGPRHRRARPTPVPVSLDGRARSAHVEVTQREGVDRDPRGLLTGAPSRDRGHRTDGREVARCHRRGRGCRGDRRDDQEGRSIGGPGDRGGQGGGRSTGLSVRRADDRSRHPRDHGRRRRRRARDGERQDAPRRSRGGRPDRGPGRHCGRERRGDGLEQWWFGVGRELGGATDCLREASGGSGSERPDRRDDQRGMSDPNDRTPSIMLSAGEVSGALHGSTLCRSIRALRPDVRLVGMGGSRMAAAGVDVLVDPTHEAVVGTSEALGRIPALYRAYRTLVSRLRDESPRALVVIDFPDFNLQLARQARQAGIPVLYFIPPQLWACRRGRWRQMARRVSRVLAVLPFERELYESAGVPVEFVGHPLLDVLPLDLSRDEARRRLGLDPSEVVVGLLPGSRREEVARLLPAMLGAARHLASAGDARRFLLALAPTVDRAAVARHVGSSGGDHAPRVELVGGRTYEVMAAADAQIIASGPATLEAALLGVPMVLCYRVSRITEGFVRMLVRVPWAGLPNIVAGRAIVPEILQDEVSPERLA